MEEHIYEKIKKHFYAYNNIGLDIPEFRITEKELFELKNYIFGILPCFQSNSHNYNSFMGVKLILVREIK